MHNQREQRDGHSKTTKPSLLKETTLRTLEAITDLALQNTDEIVTSQRRLCGRWLTQLRWQARRSQAELATEIGVEVQLIALIEQSVTIVALALDQVLKLAKLLTISKNVQQRVVEAIRCCTGQVEPSAELLAYVIEHSESFLIARSESEVDALATLCGQAFSEAFSEAHTVPEAAYAQESVRRLYPKDVPPALRRIVIDVLSAVYKPAGRDLGEVYQCFKAQSQQSDICLAVIDGVLELLERDRLIKAAPHRAEAFCITQEGIMFLADIHKTMAEQTQFGGGLLPERGR